MTDRVREAIRAIVALVDDVSVQGCWSGMTIEQDLAITALRARLAEPEPEPVAWMVFTQDGQSVFVTDNPTDIGDDQRALPLYTAPPTRRPLTDDEIVNIGHAARAVEGPHILPVTFARAIERAHKIGGNDE